MTRPQQVQATLTITVEIDVYDVLPTGHQQVRDNLKDIALLAEREGLFTAGDIEMELVDWDLNIEID